MAERGQKKIGRISDGGFIDDDEPLYLRFQRGVTVDQNDASRRPCSARMKVR